LLAVVVGVVAHDALAEFLPAFLDVGIELVAVVPDGKLLVVIYGDVDFFGADGFVGGVVELGDVGMLEALLGGESLVGVEDEEALDHVECVIRGRGKDIPQPFLLGGWQLFEHSRGQWRVDRVNILL
jgi:hypothetical protein